MSASIAIEDDKEKVGEMTNSILLSRCMLVGSGFVNNPLAMRMDPYQQQVLNSLANTTRLDAPPSSMYTSWIDLSPTAPPRDIDFSPSVDEDGFEVVYPGRDSPRKDELQQAWI